MRNKVDDSEAGRIESNAHSVPEQIIVGDVPVIVGLSRKATVRLLSPTVSGKHATLCRRDSAIDIEDHDSSYGTFVNGSRIRRQLVQPGDRIRFGALITYRVETEGLIRERSTQGMSITVDGVVLSRDGKLIVQDITFRITSDAFVGILGPSGSGKSTILNSLATFLRPEQGLIVYDEKNEVFAHLDEYREIMRHVPQDDAIFKTLTPRENLVFAARLRLGTDYEDESYLNVKVNHVAKLVGLSDHMDNKHASVLSGGERKRLSVAIELLQRPRLLLLDEPTSGLDPGTEAQLMEHLRHISRQGTTVICTTHLMHNIRLLDTVIVLGVFEDTGRIAYCGPPKGLMEHFECTDFADLFDKLKTGDFALFHDMNAEMDSTAGSSSVPRADGDSTGPTRSRPSSKTTRSSEKVTSVGHMTIPQLASPLLAAKLGHQCANLFVRALILIRRDRKLSCMMLAQPMFLGLLICLTQYEASYVTSLLFFSIVVAIWMGLNNSVRELIRERELYIRDRLAGLRPGAYLASKWMVYTVIGVGQLILLLVIVRCLGTLLLNEPVADDLRSVPWFWLFCVLLACYTGALGLGFLISALVNSEETAVALLPLLIMPQILVSAVGTLQVEEVYHRPHETRPFRPLVVKIRSNDPLRKPAAVVDALSLACFSRPAILLADRPTVPREFGPWIWIADFIHLVALVLGTWALTFWGFNWADQRWIRLIGVG